MIKSIKKRDGRIVNFEPKKIATAIARAFQAVGRSNDDSPSRLAERVAKEATKRFSEPVTGIEDVQDICPGYCRACPHRRGINSKEAEA